MPKLGSLPLRSSHYTAKSVDAAATVASTPQVYRSTQQRYIHAGLLLLHPAAMSILARRQALDWRWHGDDDASRRQRLKCIIAHFQQQQQHEHV